MKTAILLAFLTTVCVAMPQDNPSPRNDPVSIIFDSKPIIVNPSESLTLDCGVSGEYRYCHWQKDSDQVLQVEDVHEGLLDGLEKPAFINGNECGIVINHVTTEDHGTWECKVFIRGQTLSGTKNVTVTTAPTRPKLEVANRPLLVTEGDQRTVTCSVAAARPQVTINWFLGDEEITYNSRTENSLVDNQGTYKSISTLNQVFKAWHNLKSLRCSISHYTLEQPIEDYVDINVKYKPWGKDVRQYGIRLGHDVEATIDFSSNPPPQDVKWGYGPAFEDIQAVLPVPGEEGRYSTEVITLETGHYAVILRVLEFTEMDAHMSFKIAIENELGVRDFKVVLSNEKPPNEPISSGLLAVIVVTVALVLGLLVCIVYMRYHHMHCFAKKKPLAENASENGNSTAETANGTEKAKNGTFFGKLQNGLKKKPSSPSAKTESAPQTQNGTEATKAENGATNEVN